MPLLSMMSPARGQMLKMPIIFLVRNRFLIVIQKSLFVSHLKSCRTWLTFCSSMPRRGKTHVAGQTMLRQCGACADHLGPIPALSSSIALDKYSKSIIVALTSMINLAQGGHPYLVEEVECDGKDVVSTHDRETNSWPYFLLQVLLVLSSSSGPFRYRKVKAAAETDEQRRSTVQEFTRDNADDCRHFACA